MTGKTFEEGLAIRREVLGDAYVDRALDRAGAFGEEFQQLMTRYCWGEIWGRDGLDRRTRSMLNLAMLAVLNRGTEFKAHTRGALTNGVTREEIREVLLQVMIYGGVPAGVEAFRLAGEVLAEIDADG